jgi:hypothetical protein
MIGREKRTVRRKRYWKCGAARRLEESMLLEIPHNLKETGF